MLRPVPYRSWCVKGPICVENDAKEICATLARNLLISHVGLFTLDFWFRVYTLPEIAAHTELPSVTQYTYVRVSLLCCVIVFVTSRPLPTFQTSLNNVYVPSLGYVIAVIVVVVIMVLSRAGDVREGLPRPASKTGVIRLRYRCEY